MGSDDRGEYRRVGCAICGNTAAKAYAVDRTGDERALHRQRDRCTTCGLVYSNPQATESKMEEFYSGEYPEVFGGRDMIYDLSFFDREVDDDGRGRGRYLDVGCARGFRMKTAEQLGWHAYGVELSKAFCDYATEVHGLNDVCRGTLFDAHFEDSSFDLITLWHVLEHVPDPVVLLKELQRIMKPSAVLIVGVPNIMEPIYQITRCASRLRGAVPGMPTSDQHTYDFTPTTLRKLIRSAAPQLKEDELVLFYEDETWDVVSSRGMNWKGKMQVCIARFLESVLKKSIGCVMRARYIKNHG